MKYLSIANHVSGLGGTQRGMAVNSLLVFLLQIFLLDDLSDVCACLGTGKCSFNYGYEALLVSALDLTFPESYGEFQMIADDRCGNRAYVLFSLRTAYYVNDETAYHWNVMDGNIAL